MPQRTWLSERRTWLLPASAGLLLLACVPLPAPPPADVVVSAVQPVTLRSPTPEPTLGPPNYPTPRPSITPPTDLAPLLLPGGFVITFGRDGAQVISQVPGLFPGQGASAAGTGAAGGAGNGGAAGAAGGSGTGAGGAGSSGGASGTGSGGTGGAGGSAGSGTGTGGSGGTSGGGTGAGGSGGTSGGGGLVGTPRYDLPVRGVNMVSYHSPRLPGDDSAMFGPSDVVVNAAGEIYLADAAAHVIRISRRVSTPAGEVRRCERLAGNGAATHRDGVDVEASFQNPRGLALAKDGRLFVADTGNHCIRLIAPHATLAGVLAVYTVAGRPGVAGHRDGVGQEANFDQPWDLTVDREGNLLVSDRGNHCLRKVTPAGVVTTVAGTPSRSGYQDGDALQARFDDPQGIVVTAAGDLFVCDSDNHCLRRVAPTGLVSTYAGVAGTRGHRNGPADAALFHTPTFLSLAKDGSFYVSDSGNRRLRQVGSDYVVRTLAGTGEAGELDGPGAFATFRGLAGVAWDETQGILMAEELNRTLRVLRYEHSVTTDFGHTTPGDRDDRVGEARFRQPIGLAFDRNGVMYLADTGNHTIRRITLQGEVALFAGRAATEGSRDGTRLDARFRRPRDVVVDLDGMIYVADTGNHCIRRIAPDASVTTLAGAGTAGFADGQGSAAQFNTPSDLSLGPDGNLYVADTGNHRIRMVTPSGAVTTLAGGAEPGFRDDRGSAAQFFQPSGLVVDGLGRVYIADRGNHALRLLTRDSQGGIRVRTFAGAGGQPGYRDGAGLSARFNEPTGLSLDGDNRLYVADTGNSLLRRVEVDGSVTTAAGAVVPSTGAPRSGYADGLSNQAMFSAPEGVLVDLLGYVYVVDTANHCIRRIH
ncbi:MAG: hypothetical protein VKP62_14595 [Candidatus Sericytochromatia bacterium]|nr:hypothetical protein [Candidatus Sericytochromatia bacterium]